MSRIHPVQVLLDEHRLIEEVLGAFESNLGGLPSTPFPGQWFFESLDFFRHFVEGCHHDKEEELVFPQLRAAGLIQEHDAGSAYLDRGGDSPAGLGRRFRRYGPVPQGGRRVRAFSPEPYRAGG